MTLSTVPTLGTNVSQSQYAVIQPARIRNWKMILQLFLSSPTGLRGLGVFPFFFCRWFVRRHVL